VNTPDGIQSGRVQKAPENFLDRDGISTVIAESKAGRRNFIRSAFAAAAAGVAAPMALAPKFFRQLLAAIPTRRGIADTSQLNSFIGTATLSAIPAPNGLCHSRCNRPRPLSCSSAVIANTGSLGLLDNCEMARSLVDSTWAKTLISSHFEEVLANSLNMRSGSSAGRPRFTSFISTSLG